MPNRLLICKSLSFCVFNAHCVELMDKDLSTSPKKKIEIQNEKRIEPPLDKAASESSLSPKKTQSTKSSNDLFDKVIKKFVSTTKNDEKDFGSLSQNNLKSNLMNLKESDSAEQAKMAHSQMSLLIDNLPKQTVKDSSKYIRVLSLDGGGVRGLIQALYLEYIEEVTGKPICDLFHVICGTSVGGINTAALTTPLSKDEPNKPRFTAKDLISLYVKDSKKMFHKRTFSLNSFNTPKYSGKELRKVFKQKLINDDGSYIKWSDHIGHPITLAYNTHLRKIHYFNKKNATEKDSHNFYTHDIIRAISSAPTYYNPAKIENKPDSIPELRDEFDLVDAGILLNNPVQAALLEVDKLYPENKKKLVVSIGTGVCQKPYYVKDLKNKGILKSAKKIIDMSLDNGMMTHDFMLDQEQSDLNLKYYRFQLNLGAENSKLDDTSKRNLSHLIALVNRDIEDNRKSLNELCAILATEKYDKFKHYTPSLSKHSSKDTKKSTSIETSKNI